jgi:putative FmdB family regulatory protein
MPTYEYACRSCGHTFETVQSMKDEALTVCPECGGDLRKVFAPPAIAFKGSGFYATDHGKQARPGAATKKDGGAKPEGGGDKGGSDKGGGDSGGGDKGGGDKGSTATSAATTAAEGSS